jgi:hypothetical protein
MPLPLPEPLSLTASEHMANAYAAKLTEACAPSLVGVAVRHQSEDARLEHARQQLRAGPKRTARRRQRSAINRGSKVYH